MELQIFQFFSKFYTHFLQWENFSLWKSSTHSIIIMSLTMSHRQQNYRKWISRHCMLNRIKHCVLIYDHKVKKWCIKIYYFYSSPLTFKFLFYMKYNFTCCMLWDITYSGGSEMNFWLSPKIDLLFIGYIIKSIWKIKSES